MAIPTDDRLLTLARELDEVSRRIEDAAADADNAAHDCAEEHDAARAVPVARMADALWRLGGTARRAALELEDLADIAAKIPAPRR
jgi:hypothetical protein